MYIYKVVLGDSEGSSNVESLNIKARDFHEAYKKAIVIQSKRLSAVMRGNEKEKPEDRLPKNYHYTIDEISFVLEFE